MAESPDPERPYKVVPIPVDARDPRSIPSQIADALNDYCRDDFVCQALVDDKYSITPQFLAVLRRRPE